MSHVFISYSKKNRDYARKLADHLLSLGFDVWIDDRVDYGEDWELAVFRAIDACAAFIVIMTPESYASQWVRRECHHAEKRKKPPFPLLLEGEEFPRYGITQYADVRDGQLPEDGFYIRVAQHVPRNVAKGSEVTETPPIQTPSLIDKLTLHEAIVIILRENGNKWMHINEIAAEINRRGLYYQGDGSEVPAGQIRTRVTKERYSHLFEKNGSLIRLKE